MSGQTLSPSSRDCSRWVVPSFEISLTRQTLQTPSPPYSEIPRKLIVAKRLAQCLNPALPSGVHAMALDVYGQVFSMIGVGAGHELMS
jgi:hypothetical protein